MRQSKLTIREATEQDKDDIWIISRAVIKKRDTYAFSPNTNKRDLIHYWFGEKKATFVAVLDGQIVGIFNIHPNHIDLMDHVANASYMVAPKFQSKGIGKKMAEYSLNKAKKLGYKAMNFNYIVKSNVMAIKLWKKLGFRIIGEIPKAFRHPTKGLVNILIMYKELD